MLEDPERKDESLWDLAALAQNGPFCSGFFARLILVFYGLTASIEDEHFQQSR